MDQLFGSLKSFVKPQACVIDNNVYRLHYKFSVVILIAFSLMVTGRQYFGDPIDCISRDDIPGELLDNFCWIHTTFSLTDAWNKTVGKEVPYPGIDKYIPDEKRVYHAYYQWVCFVLFFQALFFYIPRYIWKAAEAGRVKNLMLSLHSPILDAGSKEKDRKLLVEYLHRNLNNHNTSFFVYTLTEALNLLNVILQMVMMDRFLGGEFTAYGWKVIQFTEWDWSVRFDPMMKIFPRLTKCTFHKFGSSGDVQKHDAMCILPINIVNEKIYIFLWFWFYFLAIVSILALVYRVLIIVVPRLRILATQSRCRLVNREALEAIISRQKIGDWFLLDLLSKNVDPLNFRDLVYDLHRSMEGGKASEAI